MKICPGWDSKETHLNWVYLWHSSNQSFYQRALVPSTGGKKNQKFRAIIGYILPSQQSNALVASTAYAAKCNCYFNIHAACPIKLALCRDAKLCSALLWSCKFGGEFCKCNVTEIKSQSQFLMPCRRLPSVLFTFIFLGYFSTSPVGNWSEKFCQRNFVRLPEESFRYVLVI